MEQLKIVKKQLVLDLDKNEAPAAWRWRIDRFVKFDDGSEKIVADEIPATAEEVSAHVGSAVARQAADIERDRIERDKTIAGLTAKSAADIEALTAKAATDVNTRDAQLATAAKLNEGLAAKLEEAVSKLARIAQADAQYDAAVKPLFAAPEQTKQ